MLFAVVATVLAAVTPQLEGAATGPARALVAGAQPKDARLPPGVVPVTQSVQLRLDPDTDTYSGTVSIDVDVATATRTIWLNARGLAVSTATVTSGTPQKATFTIADAVEGFARLDMAAPVSAGRATIDLAFTGRYRDDLQGLYRVSVDGAWYVFSQFEAVSAREAFPCFDEPSFKIPFSISVTHKKGITAVGNTRTTKQSVVGDELTVTFADTLPLPTYLLAVAVGPLDIVQGPVLPASTLRAAPLSIRGLAPKGKGALLKTSLQRSAAVIVDLEKAFGIGYPYDKLDIVAVPDFGAGAMENAGLVTYRDTLLYVDDDSAIAVQKSNLGVIAHEFAHQWFGNLVTMGFWDDLWLNEAFATWMAARSVHRLRPDFDGAFDLRETSTWAMGEDSLVSARRIREPIKNRGDIENAFDGITYSKGAAVIAMFEEWIDRQKGAGTFMSGVTRYLLDHRHGTGTTADFLAAISTAAGMDVATPFATFLDQAGVPLVTASCEVQGGKAGLAVSIRRFLPVGSGGDGTAHFTLPICASFLDGKKSVVRCGLVDGSGVVDLGRATCPAAVHPNADGAGYYRFSMPGAQMKALAQTTSSMTAGERLLFGNALNGAFATATVPFGDVLASGLPLANDAETSIAMVPQGLLSFARDRVFVDDAAAQARVQDRIARLYQPALNRLGLVDRATDTPRDRERRAALVSVLADANPRFGEQVAHEARAWLAAPKDQLAKDVIPAALRTMVRVEVKDRAAFDALLARAKSEPDPRVRGWILRALASTRLPTLRDAAIGLVFEENLRVNEKGLGLWTQGGDPVTAAHAFEVLVARYDEIAGELPEDWRASFPNAAAGLCTDADAARVEAFFAPKVPTVPGLDRNLAQTVEGIRLCAARVKAHSADVKKTLR
jgi:alanyl aminopeptidase